MLILQGVFQDSLVPIAMGILRLPHRHASFSGVYIVEDFGQTSFIVRCGNSH